MEEEFEIGQLVKWQIGPFRLWGIFVDKINDETSEVKCVSKNGRRHIQTVKVLTKLLSKKSEKEEWV